MLASIGRGSEKSSQDDYEDIHDEMTREELFLPLKRKFENRKCLCCLPTQSSSGEEAKTKKMT